MVLIDTSIWIRFFANRQPFKAQLDVLLSLDKVMGHELVYGELLIGDKGGRSNFLAAYKHMHQAKAVAHSDLVNLVKLRRLHGLGIGWIDVHLLASALANHLKLWTADDRLTVVATLLGVAWDPSSPTSHNEIKTIN